MSQRLVVKFGGTSVGSASAIGQAADIVRALQGEGHQVAVVTSAMSGVTDALLSGASMVDGKYGFPFGPKVGARYESVGGLVPQGISAELIADKWGLTREELDAFGLRSQQYAARARDEGRFEREILPVLGADGEYFLVQ